MPIKFRCQYCKQFLGISRKKAGEIVDCPTCGRTLRVPLLDGKVIPLPKLQLDLKDSSLTRAMEELAVLGEIEEESPNKVTASFSGVDQTASKEQPLQKESEIPDAPSFYHGKGDHGKETHAAQQEESEEENSFSLDYYSEPNAPPIINLPPMVTPEIIEFEPPELIPQETEPAKTEPDKSEPIQNTIDSAVSADIKPPVVSQTEVQEKVVATTDFVASEIQHLADEQQDKELIPKAEYVPKVSVRLSSQSPQQVTFSKKNLIAIISVSLVTGLLLGWLMATLLTSQKSPSENVTKNGQKETNTKDAAKNNHQNKNSQRSPGLPFGQIAVRGRITYKTEQQSTRPDKGARVIVLPESRDGEARIPHVGFRGGDTPFNFKVAEAALHVLGGDAAIVNDKGEYEINLPEAGRYHIVIISHFQSRDESAKVDVSLRGLLRGYFDRPEQLLGKLAFRFDEINFNGDDVEIKDFTFDGTQ